jgi:hypothetical protein
VIAAFAVVVVLGGLLVVRLLAQEPAIALAPSASVPEPARLDAGSLEVPCWSCPYAKEWPLRFRTDLDLLAPLGTGDRNAGEFFALFEKERGSRAKDALAFMDRRVETPGHEEIGAAVPGDDPLLLEAEPWVDQAQLWFYPDIYPMEGIATRIPNLLFTLALARSWTLRGVLAEDPLEGIEDCRRAIRLGRLLRQEDVILINDLVGLACIHIGSRGVFEIAQRTGDHDLALLASIVLGEVAPQRLFTSQRITALDVTPDLSRNADGSYHLDSSERRIEALIDTLESSPDRRFLGEALMDSHAVLYLGTESQRARIRKAVESVAGCDDAVFETVAKQVLSEPPSEELFKQLLPPKS